MNEILPRKADYLRRAEQARQEATKAPEGSLLRDSFLNLAAEWERLAGVIPDQKNVGV
jgi:hypothetical protein